MKKLVSIVLGAFLFTLVGTTSASEQDIGNCMISHRENKYMDEFVEKFVTMMMSTDDEKAMEEESVATVQKHLDACQNKNDKEACEVFKILGDCAKLK